MHLIEISFVLRLTATYWKEVKLPLISISDTGKSIYG
jgi:hypothetical protein